MRFSAYDAAFEGFRVTRRHPLAVLAWAAVMLGANVASALAVAAIAGPSWMEFERISASASPDTAALAALAPKILPAALVSVLLQMAGAGMVNTSVLRALLRPERRAWVGFGVDELRVVGLSVMFVAVSFVASFLLSLVFGVAGMAVAGVAAIAPLASLVVLVVLAIRFSLAGPMTVGEHRFRFRASWPATRGWFWPLLGAELLAASLALAVVFLAHIIFVSLAGAFVVAQGGSLLNLPGMFSPDFSTTAQLWRPAPLVYVAFISVLYAMVLAILVAPPVELYRTLRAEDGPQG